MCLQECLTLGVVSAGDRVVVPGAAIRFHDHSVLGPAEVRDDASSSKQERLVDVGTNEAGIHDEVEQDILELAARRRRVRKHATELA